MKIEGKEETDLRRMYGKDMSMQAIANYYGVSIGTIWSRFKEYKMSARTLSEIHRRYAINEDFFKMWSKEQAWLYGWALGDGNFTDPTTFRFTLQRGDKEVLEKFKILLKSEHPIYDEIRYDKKYKKNYYKSYIGFTSMKLVAGLRKLSYFDIPDIYLPDFIRGFFEAEGSLTKPHKRYPGFTAVLGQKKRGILDFISQSLKRLNIVRNGSFYHDKKNDVWTLKFNFYDTVQLCHFMYDDCDNLFLKRKKERFEDLMERWKKSKETYKQRWKEKSWVQKHSKKLNNGTITVDEIWQEENKIRKAPIKRSSVLRRINAMGYKTVN